MYGGDEVSSLVYDLGAFNTRVGYSGEDCPKCVMQTAIGISRSSDNNNVSYFFGEAQLRYFKENTRVYNIVGSNGYIENFELFEKITEEMIINHLRVDPKDHPILFTEPSYHNKEMRIKLTEIMFEKYSIPAMYISKSAVLSAFSLGRSTCLVLDSGHYSTYATPVQDGFALQKSLIKYDVGGNFVLNELAKSIEKKGITVTPFYKFNKNIIDNQMYVDYIPNIKEDPSFENFWKKEILRDMKETSLAVLEDLQSKLYFYKISRELKASQTSYELPDGKVVDLNEEKYGILEKFFHMNKEISGFNGIHQMVIDAINKCDLDIKKEMYSSIIFTGGNSLFNGFNERLYRQINNSCPQSVKIKVNIPQTTQERKFSSWIGGSILSSLGNFHQKWLSKQEYEEHGAMIIERKCD